MKNAANDLKKKLAKAQKDAKDKGLKELDPLFKQLQEGIENLNKKDDLDRKKAMISLNNMAKSLEERGFKHRLCRDHTIVIDHDQGSAICEIDFSLIDPDPV